MGKVNPQFTDFDGIQKFLKIPEQRVIRDLARFSQEFLGQIREFRRLAPWFLKRYCQARGRQSDFRRLYKRLQQKLKPTLRS